MHMFGHALIVVFVVGLHLELAVSSGSALLCSGSSCALGRSWNGTSLGGILCYCDRNCTSFNDCCFDASATIDSSGIAPKASSWACLSTMIPNKMAATSHSGAPFYTMIATCSSQWASNHNSPAELYRTVSRLCESSSSPTHLSPTTDRLSGRVYRNLYCGLCNNVLPDYLVEWPSLWACGEEFKSLLSSSFSALHISSHALHSNCQPQWFLPPDVDGMELAEPRSCLPFVSHCPGVPLSANLSDHYNDLMSNCSMSGINALVGRNRTVRYRNRYCAQCNGEPEDIVGTANYNCLNDSIVTHFVEASSSNSSVIVREVSGQLQLHSPLFGMPFEIAHNLSNCTTEYNIVENNCPNRTFLSASKSCDVVIVERPLYSFIDSVTIGIGRTVTTVVWFGSNGTVAYCFSDTAGAIPIGRYPLPFIVISVITLLVDCLAGVVLLVTYSLFAELRTLYGKLLMHTAAVLIIEDVIVIIGGISVESDTISDVGCVVLAILNHYFILVRLIVMCVLVFEITRHLHDALNLRAEKHDHDCIRLLVYITLPHAVSFSLVIICIILNFTVEGAVNYGNVRDSCWFSNLYALIFAYLLPSALMMAFNVSAVIYCFVALAKMWKSDRYSKSQKQGGKDLLWRNIRIIVAILAVSGFAWIFSAVFEFDQTLDNRSLWFHYIFIIFITTQLIAIAFAYLFTKKIASLYRDLFARIVTKFSKFRRKSQSTQDTPL